MYVEVWRYQITWVNGLYGVGSAKYKQRQCQREEWMFEGGNLSAAGRPRDCWSLEAPAPPELGPLHVRWLHLVRALPYLTQTDGRVEPATSADRSLERRDSRPFTGRHLSLSHRRPNRFRIHLASPSAGTGGSFFKNKSDGLWSSSLTCI
jgi:hypothetical protein